MRAGGALVLSAIVRGASAKATATTLAFAHHTRFPTGGEPCLSRTSSTSSTSSTSGSVCHQHATRRLTAFSLVPTRTASTGAANLWMAAVPPAPSSPPLTPVFPGTAFEAAAYVRGGAVDEAPPPEDPAGIAESAARGGLGARKDPILIDKVEDLLGGVGRSLTTVLVPAFNVVRFGFGLTLLFYGMAFRTFAFHVIVFRIAGLRQVRRSLGQLAENYRNARKGIREAADAAETVGERVVQGDKLKKAREKMIGEKKRLLSDGVLTKDETSYFMRKYNSELQEIVKEQETFDSAKSSIFSVRKSVDAAGARASIISLYSAMLASFTASTIQTAGQITLGLHVGSLLKTHILDMFGPVLDPIGYRLDLNTYCDQEDIPYMGKANAMDGPANLLMNLICYSVVFVIFRVHPSIALKTSMVYYGARVVTDYVLVGVEPLRKRLGLMAINHTPWSASIHVALTVLGFYLHRGTIATEGIRGLHPLAVGPGAVGLLEPFVRLAVKLSELLHNIDFFSVRFVSDPVEAVKDIASRASK